MYIAYQYKAALPPDPFNSDALTISRLKNLVVQDLSTIITSISSKYDLSDACLNVNYYGTDSGWVTDTDKEDIDYEYHIKSTNSEEYYQKFITISTLDDTATDTYGFTRINNGDGTTSYSDAKNLVTLNLTLQMYDSTDTLCTQSKSRPLKIYAEGGTIHIHLNKNHLMMSSINTSNDKYSSPIGVADIASTDILQSAFPRFIFFTCNTWGYTATLPTPVYSTRKSSTTTYGAVISNDNEYQVDIYDKLGIINFYNPDSASHKYYYGNHVYVSDKQSSNYLFGGSISELGKFYALPSSSISAKIYDEITMNGTTYIIWPIQNNDFSTSYMRLLLLKG
jgi:hypothetical protein